MVGQEIKYIAIVFVAIYTIFIHCHVVLSADGEAEIPADDAQLVSWFNTNVKPFADRKGTLDPELAEAEAEPRVIKVRKDGSGEFKTINEAIKSIPTGNTKRVILWIGQGVHQEKVRIERDKKFVTLYGSPNAMPNLTFAGRAVRFGTINSATLIAESDYFMACNIIVTNSAPRPDGKMVRAQAAAMWISSDKAAFYNCKIIGFEDSLFDGKGNHFFKDCHVEGSANFIFGSGKSLYLNTTVLVPPKNQFTVITAQARGGLSENSGYSFVHCNMMGSGNGTYLGREWKASPEVAYAYTRMSQVVNPAGWSDTLKSGNANTVFYGEYKCSGAGSNPSGRIEFTKQLSEAEVKPFLNLGYIGGAKWLLPPPKL